MCRARILLVAAMLIVSSARAQVSTLTVFGDDHNDLFGYAVSGAGDVNGDGHDDFIVAAVNDDNNGTDSGSVRVFSGSDGSILLNIDGDGPGIGFGIAVSGVGDLNGDGHADFIVGAFWDDTNGVDAGSARVFSGLDGSILHTFHGDDAGDLFGLGVSGAGDVNGDGCADLIVGAHYDDDNGLDSGSARVFSGLDGTILYTFHGDSAGDFFGKAVSGAGDVNGDGFADLIVGAQEDDDNGPNSGSARIYSGFDGSILHTFVGNGAGDAFGFSVSGAGDVDADGRADVIVGANADAPNGFASGSAWVYSGSDGSLIHGFLGDDAFDNFGYAVSGAGDVNGDGFADLVVGALLDDNSATNSGSVRVFSGLDGTILHTFDGDGTGAQLGQSVSGIGDADGDGFADVIAGAPLGFSNGVWPGLARLYRMPTLPVLKYRTTSGLPHFLDQDWAPTAADPHALTGTITVSGATPGAWGLAVVSAAAGDDLHFGFLPGLIDFNPANLVSWHGFAFDLAGSLTIPGVSRQSPYLAGTRIYLQFFELKPLLCSSPALRIELVP